MLVSFGSSLRSSHMPPEKMQMFLEVFRRLDIAVVWKWEGEIRDLPDNILVSSWLPQQDLLGHPNLKVSRSLLFSHYVLLCSCYPRNTSKFIVTKMAPFTLQPPVVGR